MFFTQVFWKRLYKTSSSMERGTLYQIRNLLNRRNITKRPKGNVNAAEDFLEVIIISHVLAAVMTYLGMSSLHDVPSPSLISPDVWMEDDAERRRILTNISSSIVSKHVDLDIAFKTSPSQDSAQQIGGTVYDYACEVMSLGLFFLDLKDAVREGDGDRVLLQWKYLLLLFKSSGRTNYSIEALTFLTQYYMLLPPNLAEQLKWSKFVNTSGLPGHNISCDLHNEHLNRLVKVAIEGLGANKSKKAIIRVAKAIGILSKVTDSFDEAVGVGIPSGKHSKKSMEKDVKVVIEQLMESKVFNPSILQSHKSFSTLKTNLIRTLDEMSLKEWMIERFSLHLHPPAVIVEPDSEDSDS